MTMNTPVPAAGDDSPQFNGHERASVWSLPPDLDRPDDAAATRWPMQVLLAEDNLVDQVTIKRLLEKRGCSVACAETGQDAVERAGTGQYDLVLMDILMPEFDGFEAARQIREGRNGRNIPIVALTAYSLNAVYERCRAVGIDGYLSKPVAVADLGFLFDQLIALYQSR